jgi:hypothetical protein
MAAMKKADILKQRELHRGDPQGFVLSFAVNYSAPARLMHSFLPPTKGKEDILQAAMRAYVNWNCRVYRNILQRSIFPSA